MNNSGLQEKNWKNNFGKEYTFRNPLNTKEMNDLYLKNFGFTRTDLNKEFLAELEPSIKILEVGANIGTQLMFLKEISFNNLYGIEINRQAVDSSKLITKGIDIIQGSALDIPFKDNYFDLVFTSGLLIHISPADIKRVMKEIYRVAKKYIWGYEYYADDYTEVAYRGKENMLWKANFPKLYLSLFKDLKLIKEKKFKYLNNENIDVMFLLRK